MTDKEIQQAIKEKGKQFHSRKKKSLQVKKPLPVGLTKAQHEYLERQDVGKAEYMRNLLVIDMEKNK